VATLGTALTEEHAKLLKRYVSRVTLLFDADAAGLRAARRAGDALVGTGLEIRVARLSGVKDPDELLRAQGAPALQSALDAAVPLFEFCVQAGMAQAQANGGLTPQVRVAVLADLHPLLVKLASAVEIEAELAKAAQAVGVSPEAAAEDYAAFKKGARRVATLPLPGAAAAGAAAPALAAVRAPEGLTLAEREIVRLLVCEPSLVEEAKLDIAEPVFSTPELQAAIDLLWRAPGGSILALTDDGSEAHQVGENLLRELSFQPQALSEGLKPAELLKDLLAIRQERLLERDRADLKLALRQAEASGATELLKKIQLTDQAILDLRRERRQKHLATHEDSE
jgi:DNA primase